MRVIRTKLENFRLWEAGAFGNRLHLWHTTKAWRESGFSGLVVLRYLGLGGAWCEYDVEPKRVEEILARWSSEGANMRQVMINEAIPADDVILQGEIWTGGDKPLAFHYSTLADHMRPALSKGGQYCQYLQTRNLLRGAMTPSSFCDLEELLAMYDRHAVELSIFRKCLGNIPGRNTLVWEVRRY